MQQNLADELAVELNAISIKPNYRKAWIYGEARRHHGQLCRID